VRKEEEAIKEKKNGVQIGNGHGATEDEESERPAKKQKR
jgi:hypothetical protein